MLHTQGLSYTYSGSVTFRFPDLICPAGEVRLITGASGAGKTTLLHLVAGLRRPDTGTIRIGEETISSLSDRQADLFRGAKIGMVFQRPHLVGSLRVGENLRLGPWLTHRPASVAAIQAALASVGLAHKDRAYPAALSQGEQQRVTIARALLTTPALVLADEPTASLDDDNTEVVAGLLARYAAEQQAAVVIVTHDARLKTRFPAHISLTAAAV
ncbi:MAG: ATP-binding cassette domain-containing protein [Bacteroidia bacterium]|nr:ATP-binding cassette domain-containing protein [Bacteroidia bacterium]